MTTITEEWLKEIGFKWFDHERSEPHWLLWMGNVIAQERKFRVTSFEDFGLEISKFQRDENIWGVFFRADYAGRYTRFLYCRDVTEQEQLIKLIEALTDMPFDKQNVLYGNYYRPEQAAHFREEDQRRFDRQMALGHKWSDDEKDDSKAVRK